MYSIKQEVLELAFIKPRLAVLGSSLVALYLLSYVTLKHSYEGTYNYYCNCSHLKEGETKSEGNGESLGPTKLTAY